MKHFYTRFIILTLCAVATLMSADAARPFGRHQAYKVADRNTRSAMMGVARTNAPVATKAPKLLSPEEQIIITEVNGNSEIKRVVSRATTGGTNLYGLMNYTRSAEYNRGWYQFMGNNLQLKWRDPLFTYANSYAELQTSWVKGNRICGFDNWWQYGYLWGQTYYELDITTGEVLTTEDDEDCLWDGGIFLSAAYDPEENAVYGYASDDYESEETTTGLFQKTTNYPFGYEVIKEIGRSQYNTQCMAMCYNPIDKGLYGITLDLNLVKIDKATGNQTVIAHLSSQAGQYISGMTFSSTENLFYWNPAYSDTESAIVTIDPSNGAIADVISFDEGGEGFSLLAEIGSAVSAESPLRPTIESVDFAAGARGGKIVFRLPTELTDGTAMSGNMNWTSTVDGATYTSGTDAPAAEITVNYTNLTAGNHTFGMYVEKDGKKSAEITTTVYVGYDRPAAPTNVVLDRDNVHWTAVRDGVNGGVIDTQTLEYEVFLNGQSVGTTKSTVLRINVGEGKPFQEYTATVVARAGGLTSAAGVSNALNAGDPWQLPVDVTASAETFRLMTTINVDGEDENWWEVDPYRDPEAFYSGQADYVRGDDWLILPAIEFPDADKFYSIYIDCMRVANKYDDAHLEVCYGLFPDVSSMTGNVIVPDFVPQSRDYATYGNPAFKVPEAGQYYIGLHASTGKNMCGVMVHSIRIEDNDLNPDSPAAVSDLKAAPGAEGALNATVSFKLPTTTIDGSALDADAEITAVVSCISSVTVSGKPGEAQSVNIATNQGDNTITVNTSLNGKPGDKATVDVYTGVTIPGLVRNMTGEVTADMMTLELVWEAPAPYTYGGYVNPETVDYYLVTTDANGNQSSRLIGTAIGEYAYTLPEGAPQDLYTIGIEARNVAGSSDRYMAVNVLMGTPYGLPMNEDFEQEYLQQQPWVTYDESDVDWFTSPIHTIATEWKEMEGVALCGVGVADAEDESILGIPRFSTLNQEYVTVSIKAWTGEQSSNTDILAAVWGMEQPVKLGSLPYTNSDSMSMWKTTGFTLPASMLNCEWVQIFIDSHFGPDHNYTIIDEISVTGSNAEQIATVTAEGSVLNHNGTLVIRGFGGRNVTVCTLDGAVVTSFTSDGNTRTISGLDKGVYVVKAGSRSIKTVL